LGRKEEATVIKKVKFKAGLVEIHKEDVIGKTTKETIFKCSEEPHPDLRQCFVEAERHVRKILEVPNEAWPGRMKIEGVTFSHSETTGVRGAVFTGKVELEGSNSPFCFNTPHLPFEQYSETGESPLMPAAAIELLESLEAEAVCYMDGSKRAQLTLEGVAA
jgi:hypothetical protein